MNSELFKKARMENRRNCEMNKYGGFGCARKGNERGLLSSVDLLTSLDSTDENQEPSELNSDKTKRIFTSENQENSPTGEIVPIDNIFDHKYSKSRSFREAYSGKFEGTLFTSPNVIKVLKSVDAGTQPGSCDNFVGNCDISESFCRNQLPSSTSDCYDQARVGEYFETPGVSIPVQNSDQEFMTSKKTETVIISRDITGDIQNDTSPRHIIQYVIDIEALSPILIEITRSDHLSIRIRSIVGSQNYEYPKHLNLDDFRIIRAILSRYFFEQLGVKTESRGIFDRFSESLQTAFSINNRLSSGKNPEFARFDFYKDQSSKFVRRFRKKCNSLSYDSLLSQKCYQMDPKNLINIDLFDQDMKNILLVTESSIIAGMFMKMAKIDINDKQGPNYRHKSDPVNLNHAICELISSEVDFCMKMLGFYDNLVMNRESVLFKEKDPKYYDLIDLFGTIIRNSNYLIIRLVNACKYDREVLTLLAKSLEISVIKYDIRFEVPVSDLPRSASSKYLPRNGDPHDLDTDSFLTSMQAQLDSYSDHNPENFQNRAQSRRVCSSQTYQCINYENTDSRLNASETNMEQAEQIQCGASGSDLTENSDQYNTSIVDSILRLAYSKVLPDQVVDDEEHKTTRGDTNSCKLSANLISKHDLLENIRILITSFYNTRKKLTRKNKKVKALLPDTNTAYRIVKNISDDDLQTFARFLKCYDDTSTDHRSNASNSTFHSKVIGSDFLVLPMNRLAQYPLLLDRIKMYVSDDMTFETVNELSDEIRRILRDQNNEKDIRHNTELSRKILKCIKFPKGNYSEYKNFRAHIDLDKTTLFLFDDQFVVTKRDSRETTLSLTTPGSYRYITASPSPDWGLHILNNCEYLIIPKDPRNLNDLKDKLQMDYIHVKDVFGQAKFLESFEKSTKIAEGSPMPRFLFQFKKLNFLIAFPENSPRVTRISDNDNESVEILPVWDFSADKSHYAPKNLYGEVNSSLMHKTQLHALRSHSHHEGLDHSNLKICSVDAISSNGRTSFDKCAGSQFKVSNENMENSRDYNSLQLSIAHFRKSFDFVFKLTGQSSEMLIRKFLHPEQSGQTGDIVVFDEVKLQSRISGYEEIFQHKFSRLSKRMKNCQDDRKSFENLFQNMSLSSGHNPFTSSDSILETDSISQKNQTNDSGDGNNNDKLFVKEDPAGNLIEFQKQVLSETPHASDKSIKTIPKLNINDNVTDLNRSSSRISASGLCHDSESMRVDNANLDHTDQISNICTYLDKFVHNHYSNPPQDENDFVFHHQLVSLVSKMQYHGYLKNLPELNIKPICKKIEYFFKNKTKYLTTSTKLKKFCIENSGIVCGKIVLVDHMYDLRVKPGSEMVAESQLVTQALIECILEKSDSESLQVFNRNIDQISDIEYFGNHFGADSNACVILKHLKKMCTMNNKVNCLHILSYIFHEAHVDDVKRFWNRCLGYAA